MRVLYVGPLWSGGTCEMRMRALASLGHEVVPVDTTPAAGRGLARRAASRVLTRLGFPPDLACANARIERAVRESRFDVLWIDKGLTIRAETLETVRTRSPHVRLVGYSPDDMANPDNQSRCFLRGLPLYDVFFTTKTFNVAELEALGARRVVFVGNGFDPDVHRPIPVSDADRRDLGGPVGFIGACERARAESMLRLARAGVPVRIWGWTDWSGWSGLDPQLVVEGRPLWGHDYARAIASFAVNLCFLRKVNRDRQTQRSIEIPACGGFMLAERTDEHLELFEEGKEAEFFGSTEELIDKARFYLAHDDLRRKVATAGRERSVRSGYDYPSQMRRMLKQGQDTCAGSR